MIALIALSPTQIVARLLFAAVVGALVGIDREARGKPAGVRTHALVSVGAALVMICTIEFIIDSGGDPAALTRVIQGIALGIACGGGHWLPAVVAVMIVESILILGRRIDRLFHRENREER